MLPIYTSFSEKLLTTSLWIISFHHDAAWKAYNQEHGSAPRYGTN
jgi:hypothetical protein